jgi:hypothetical protein
MIIAMINRATESDKPSPFKRGALAGVSLALIISLSACAAKMEPESVEPLNVHAVPTTQGTGWVYRQDYRAGPEHILRGVEGVEVQRDVALIKQAWETLTPLVTVGQDSASPYILIKLGDLGTGRKNILRGGPLSWDMQSLTNAMKRSLPTIGVMQPRYSVHLVTVGDDARINLSDDVVAQIRLRRFAGQFMEAGVDPRLISAQVLPNREAPPSWKLAIVLRPYAYGQESTSHRLVAPQSL